MNRVYLDYNATTPLRPEVRQVIANAFDVFGNPSSIHTEGRLAKAMIEKARAQILDSLGVTRGEIIFTSSATEAAATALQARMLSSAKIEHDCVLAHTRGDISCNSDGVVTTPVECLQMANSETGVVQTLDEKVIFSDATQAFGKIPFSFDWLGCDMLAVSSHKIGGLKGTGALLISQDLQIDPLILGGGQEHGRRSGTENILGIIAFGAAAQAIQLDLAKGAWQEIEQLRNYLEDRIKDAAPDAVFFGQAVNRLPNTSCFALLGWKGETQVIQMDLAGIAISAGSACSSGKIKKSTVLQAMGTSDEIAQSAIRVSLGLQTTKDDIEYFLGKWVSAYKKFNNAKSNNKVT